MGNIQAELEDVDRIESQLQSLKQEVNPPLPLPEKKRKFIEDNIGLIFILGIAALGLAAYCAGLIRW
jgi:hypothetical protein